MGGAASIVEPSTNSSGGPSESDFPKYGVRLSFCQQFIESNGGKAVFEGLSTREVCEKFVKPPTEKPHCSYCDLLRQRNSNAVGLADVFVCHAWSNTFLEVCEALINQFKNNKDVILWFDVFSLNQHAEILKSFEWWTVTLPNVIKEIGHTVTVFTGWRELVPLQRSWCLWEIYCTVKMECRCEVFLSNSQRDIFFSDIVTDPEGIMNLFLSIVNLENAQSTIEQDKENICQAAMGSTGIVKVNNTVFTKMKEWIIGTISAEIDILSANPNGEKQMLLLKSALGRIYLQQGDYRNARIHFEVLLDPFNAVFGESHEETLQMLYSVACLLVSTDNLHDGEELYNKIIEKRKALMISASAMNMNCDLLMLKSQHRLALIHEQRGHSDIARDLFVSTYDTMLQGLGKRHIASLSIMGDLAAFYDVQGEKEKSKELYTLCYEFRKEVLGEYHPDTIAASYSLGCLLSDLQENDQALLLLDNCYHHQRSILGDAHEKTLQVLETLATIYDVIGNVDKAEEMYLKRLSTYTNHYGKHSEITMYKKLDMGKWYEEKHLDNKAEKYFIEWWKYNLKIEGPNHSKTNYAEDNLKECMIRLGKLEQFHRLIANANTNTTSTNSKGKITKH